MKALDVQHGQQDVGKRPPEYPSTRRDVPETAKVVKGEMAIKRGTVKIETNDGQQRDDGKASPNNGQTTIHNPAAASPGRYNSKERK